MADQLVAALAPLTGRPLTIFGHSLGASLGFEVARRLEQSGVIPTALFASGRPAPSRSRLERTHLRTDAGLLAAMKELGGTDAALLADEDVLAMVMPAIRGDYTAAETYTCEPGPRLSCPIYALTGDDDPKATLDEVRAWSEHTDGEFDMTVFPGGHFYLNDVVPAILERFRAHARSVSAGSPK
jgi:surfactin synthase thioesterase subunit